MNEDDNKRMIAQALLGMRLFGVQKEAADFIFGCVAKWTGEPFGKGQTLPICKDGECIKRAMPTAGGHNPPEIDAILIAAQLEDRTALKARILRIEELERTMAAFRTALAKLPLDEQSRLDLLQPSWEWDTNLRVVSALGISAAMNAAMDGASTSITRILSEERRKLAGVAKDRGRARSEAAYGVALEFARLYSIVTGKRPTYAANESGLHGEFTPSLAGLFEIFGWATRNMKRPAEDAIKNLDYAKIKAARVGQIGLFGSLLHTLDL
jgi:hypothetical protein